MSVKNIKDVNKILFERYSSIQSDDPLVQRAINMAKTALNEDMVEDKQSRWLGFIQGVLIAKNLLDTEEERDFSRPLFQEVYKLNGIYQKTITIKEEK